MDLYKQTVQTDGHEGHWFAYDKADISDAYKIVLEDIEKIDSFHVGKYDAIHGSKNFMSGVCSVMELISCRANCENWVEDVFYKNEIESEKKAKIDRVFGDSLYACRDCIHKAAYIYSDHGIKVEAFSCEKEGIVLSYKKYNGIPMGNADCEYYNPYSVEE